MESLNRIEIKGVVGSCRSVQMGTSSITTFSVAVEYGYKHDGENIIETTWFGVSAWDKDGNEAAKSLKRGDRVHVVGRVRTYRFDNADGSVRNGFEIVARSIKVVGDEDEPLEPQKD